MLRENFWEVLSWSPNRKYYYFFLMIKIICASKTENVIFLIFIFLGGGKDKNSSELLLCISGIVLNSWNTYIKTYLILLCTCDRDCIAIPLDEEIGRCYYVTFFFFFLKDFYLFIHETHTHTHTHTQREREGETGQGRSRLPVKSLIWDSIPGPLGSWPESKADAQPLSHPGVPVMYFPKATQ